MRLTVPITGTALDFDADAAKLDGCGISGDPSDPVQIALDLGNVSWRLVSIDVDTDTAEIEVAPAPSIPIPVLGTDGKQTKDKDGNPVYTQRPSTPTEQQALLTDAQNRVASFVKIKPLVKSADVVKKYMDFKAAQKTAAV